MSSDPRDVAAVAPADADAALLERSTAELVDALRRRAELLSGEKWEAPATAAIMKEAAFRLSVLSTRVTEVEKYLRAIQDGRGRFAQDRFEHACNTIESMKGLAAKALAGEPFPDDD